MGTTGSATGCLLSKTPDPAVFKSGAGTLTLLLKSTNGNITFMLKDTDVLDSGQSVNPTKTTTALSFTVVAGHSYTVEVEYFIFPTHSTGVLQENCTGGVTLSPVNIATNPQQFSIQG